MFCKEHLYIYIAVCVGKVFVSLVVGFVEGLPCMKKTSAYTLGRKVGTSQRSKTFHEGELNECHRLPVEFRMPVAMGWLPNHFWSHRRRLSDTFLTSMELDATRPWNFLKH